ncbi:MotA/TolQ/ExbB proton channel family protein [Clostridium sp. D2Q-11]|uniref:MotA/TolQ/ExbB proton channel family protein n=1 Tax=Anaeromonas frigoriresistens TaxID=2683708 RepID=A0A942V4R9_9FIRM|nr:MotA/TolQ/ExbB proton channel family protein [Anaeromonas frigoriresistens]MBS4539852.1 MotA/TolQ/ExbB proton channel family protein [Anaeromonas frigoriresistens]
MDLGTAIGFFAGLGFIIFGILLSGELITFVDVASILIVMGGTIASTLVSFPLSKVIASINVAKHAFTDKKINGSEIIGEIINLANVARKEGLLALEDAAENLTDNFLKKGILLIVDGTDPELVRNILETELVFIEERHEEGQKIFQTMANFSPAFGMIGTLIGLINMLQQLDDPTTVGPNMAVALITTFYGTVLANLVFQPIANKLKGRSRSELIVKEMIVEGLLSIQSGENPRIIEEKLSTFIPPGMREKSDESPEGEIA